MDTTTNYFQSYHASISSHECFVSKVSNLIKADSSGWNLGLLRQTFTNCDADKDGARILSLRGPEF